MTYQEYKQGQTKKAVLETAAALSGVNPAVASAVAGAATNPAVAVPMTAVGGTAAGVGLYKRLFGNKIDKAYQNMTNQINDTAKTYREYLKWRQQREHQGTDPVVPAKPNTTPSFPNRPIPSAIKQKSA